MACNTYLYSYKDKESTIKPTVNKIRNTFDSFVVFTNFYRPEFVIEKRLKGADINPITFMSVDIFTHKDINVKFLIG